MSYIGYSFQRLQGHFNKAWVPNRLASQNAPNASSIQL
jgi:hypothetical protein